MDEYRQRVSWVKLWGVEQRTHLWGPGRWRKIRCRNFSSAHPAFCSASLMASLSVLQTSAALRQWRIAFEDGYGDRKSTDCLHSSRRGFRERLAWIAALTRDALRSYDRNHPVLHLRYAPEAASRVREMVRKEQACCSFLTFEIHEDPDQVWLTIRAPEAARASVDTYLNRSLPHDAGPPPLPTTLWPAPPTLIFQSARRDCCRTHGNAANP
jgi:hypothetical protein